MTLITLHSNKLISCNSTNIPQSIWLHKVDKTLKAANTFLSEIKNSLGKLELNI